MIMYLATFLFLLVVYGVPTLIGYGLVRALSFRLTAIQAVLVAAHVVQLGAWLIAATRVGLMQPLLWGEFAMVVALVAWFVLRPGRGALLGLLAYQALGVLLSNVPPLLHNPWGAPLHRAAVSILLLRCVLFWLFARAWRELGPAPRQVANS